MSNQPKETDHSTVAHSDLAALRGEPSYVWRSGQERRLQMVANLVPLHDRVILDHGCGIGTYAAKFRERYSLHVYGFDFEIGRVSEAVDLRSDLLPGLCAAAAESLPYPENSFDVLFSNEVIEHVQDDRGAAREMVRVMKPGGHIVIFAPNRWYPVEQHGHYWRGEYHFGNTPLINYLPDVLRNRLAPHVRTYSGHKIRALFRDLPVQIIHHSRIFGGYDNIIRRLPRLGRLIRSVLYIAEHTPLQILGLSHLLVIRKNA